MASWGWNRAGILPASKFKKITFLANKNKNYAVHERAHEIFLKTLTLNTKEKE